MNEAGAVNKADARVKVKLRVIGIAGVITIIIALGVRYWWNATAPERLARIAVLQRESEERATLANAQAAIKTRPNDLEAHQALADVLIAQGRPDQAIGVLRTARDRMRKDPAAWQSLANAYLLQRQFEAAEETYEEMVRLWPRDAGALSGLAAVHRHSGRYAEALESARKAVRIAKEDAGAHYLLGAIIEEMGQRSAFAAGETALLEEGRRHLLTASKLQPGHPDADYRRGRLCLLIRRADEGRAALEAAARITPKRAVVWFALSDARLRAGAVDEAIDAARRGQEADPLATEGALALGRALLLKNDPASVQEASDVFERATQLSPRSPEAFQRLGTALLRQDRLPEARAAFETSYALAPHEPFPVQQLAQIFMRTGDAKQAEAASKQATALQENQRLLRQVQRTSSAHPENWKVRLTLARRYQEIGWLVQAEDAYAEVLRLAPNNQDARNGLGAVRRAAAAHP